MYFDVKVKEKKTDWEQFERDVAEIFDQFGYKSEQDIRFKTVRRFQIDVIAYDEKRCFFIDCKDHLYVSPGKEEDFVIKQRVRAENYLKTRTDFQYKKKIVLLVTKNKTASLINHVESHGKILSVDMSVLPDLLTNIYRYDDELYSF
jgi:Holliday junction resolvase